MLLVHKITVEAKTEFFIFFFFYFDNLFLATARYSNIKVFFVLIKTVVEHIDNIVISNLKKYIPCLDSCLGGGTLFLNICYND